MKTVIAAVLAVAACAAGLAAQGAGKSRQDPAARFQAIQTKRLAALDARIAELQKQRECVAAATDMASLRQCQPVSHVDPEVRACIQSCRKQGQQPSNQ